MERTGAIADLVTKLLALLLPLSQFFAKFLPASLISIYLGQKYFLAVSVIVLFLCAAIWIILSIAPPYSIPINIKKHKKYSLALTKHTDQSNSASQPLDKLGAQSAKVEDLPPRPFYITQDNIHILALGLALIGSIVFLWIGIIKQNPVSHVWIALQSTAYVVTTTSFFVVLIVYALRKRNIDAFQTMEGGRPQNAINKAIESRAFQGMPIVNFIGQEVAVPGQGTNVTHLVFVNVTQGGESKDYRIGTNYTGDVVYWVLPEENFTSS